MEGALDGIADWIKQDNRSLTSHHPLSVSIDNQQPSNVPKAYQ